MKIQTSISSRTCFCQCKKFWFSSIKLKNEIVECCCYLEQVFCFMPKNVILNWIFKYVVLYVVLAFHFIMKHELSGPEISFYVLVNTHSKLFYIIVKAGFTLPPYRIFSSPQKVEVLSNIDL